MKHDDIPAAIRRLRRGPLWAEAAAPQPLALERDGIESLIPHRPPFLMLDRLQGFDPEARLLRAQAAIRADDPLFAGHFPGDPVYPGALLLEILAQASGCLWALAAGGGGAALKVRGTRVLHALFLEAVRPGDALTLDVAMVEDGDFLAVFGGQVWVGGRLCALALLEVCIVD